MGKLVEQAWACFDDQVLGGHLGTTNEQCRESFIAGAQWVLAVSLATHDELGEDRAVDVLQAILDELEEEGACMVEVVRDTH